VGKAKEAAFRSSHRHRQYSAPSRPQDISKRRPLSGICGRSPPKVPMAGTLQYLSLEHSIPTDRFQRSAVAED